MASQTKEQPTSTLAASLAMDDVTDNLNTAGDWQSSGIRLKVLEQIEIVRVQISGSNMAPVLEIKSAIENALSCRLPEPGKYSTIDDGRVHWITPKEWWTITSAGKAQAVCECLEGLPVHTTEIADSRFTVAVSGGAAALLAQGCALDLHEDMFSIGSSSVTRLAKIPALITRTDVNCYEVNIDRSYARYLWAWLKDAIKGLDSITA